MSKIMITICSPHCVPTVDDVIRDYDIHPHQIDRDFGVVEVDPDEHAYAILVEPEAGEHIAATGKLGVSGPYANPEIGSFGLKR